MANPQSYGACGHLWPSVAQEWALIYSRRQTETGSHCSRPEPERTVDVDPRPRGAGGRDDLLERVEGAGVDLSGLEGASDCQTVAWMSSVSSPG